MAKIDLSKYGITGATDIVYNPSYFCSSYITHSFIRVLLNGMRRT